MPANIVAKFVKNLKIAPLWFSAVMVVGTQANAQSVPSDVQMLTPATSSAISFNSWFTAGAPSVDGFVSPDDSLNFSDSPNKDFYRWSYRMFLWLLSPSPSSYGGSGRVFSSSEFFNVSPPDTVTAERTLSPNPFRIGLAGKIGVVETFSGRSKKVKKTIVRKKPIANFDLRVANLGPDGLPVLLTKDGTAFEVLQPKVSKAGRPIVINSDGKEIEIARITQKEGGSTEFLDIAGNRVEKPNFQMQARFEKRLGFDSEKLRSFDEKRFVFKLDPNLFRDLIFADRPIFVFPSGAVLGVEVNQSDGTVQLTRGGSLIYYSISVNDVFAYYLTCNKNGSCPSNQFPTTAADIAAISTFAASHGHTFASPNALAMEFKMSWVDAATLPNSADYITMRARVPDYVPNSDGTQWDKVGTKVITVALLGVHVVGSAKGHPELIWASFEHVGNTANVAYDYKNLSGTTVTNPADAVSGSTSWLFTGLTSPVPPFIAGAFAGSNGSIVSNSIQPVQGTSVLRLAPWGAPSNATPNPAVSSVAQSNSEILSLNKDIHDQMPGDVRSNYLFIGATWTIGGAGPTHNFHGSFSDNVVGTSHLANSTMETFTQSSTFVTGTFPGPGCFACHKTNTTTTSHIFSETKPLFP
jgi:hypothetical protein